MNDLNINMNTNLMNKNMNLNIRGKIEHNMKRNPQGMHPVNIPQVLGGRINYEVI